MDARTSRALTFRCTASATLLARLILPLSLLGLLFVSRFFCKICVTLYSFSISSATWDILFHQCPFMYYLNPNRPVRRLKRELDAVFPSWTNSLPSTSSCSLTAADNVFGRLVNARPGAASVAVCTVATRCEDVSGQFIHIEQDDEARKDEHHNNWATAICNSFQAI